MVVSLVRGTLTRLRLYAFTALGIGDFVVAIVTGLALRPLIVFPTLAVPFVAMLHIVSLIQARHDWDERVARLSGRA